MLKKKVCAGIFLCLFLFISLVLIWHANVVYRIAFWIFEIENKTNEIYFDKIEFKLAERNKQIYGGDTEKYVLESQGGKLWLFKVRDESLRIFGKEVMFEAYNVIGYKLAKLYGLNIPESHEFSCLINGRVRKGFIQGIVEFDLEFEDIGELYAYAFAEKDSKLIAEIVAQEMFSWVLCNDNEQPFLLTSEGKLYRIDLDNTFKFAGFKPGGYCNNNDESTLLLSSGGHSFQKELDSPFKAEKCCSEYYLENVGCLPAFYRFQSREGMASNKGASFYYKKASRFVRNIQKTPKVLLREYLKDGINYIETEAHVNKSVEIILNRIGMLPGCSTKDELLSKSLAEKEFVLFPASILNACLQSFKNIIRKTFAISRVKRHEVGNKMLSLDMVSSGHAWNIIEDSISDDWMDKKVDVHSVLIKDLQELYELRRTSETLQEKLAVSMYIQQVRTFRDNVERYGITCRNKKIVTPIIYSLDDIRNINVDEWVGDLKCDGIVESGGRVKISRIEGEDDYMRGLIEFLGGQRYMAEKYFNDAYAKRYERQEISDIQNKWLAK